MTGIHSRRWRGKVAVGDNTTHKLQKEEGQGKQQNTPDLPPPLVWRQTTCLPVAVARNRPTKLNRARVNRDVSKPRHGWAGVRILLCRAVTCGTHTGRR